VKPAGKNVAACVTYNCN